MVIGIIGNSTYFAHFRNRRAREFPGAVCQPEHPGLWTRWHISFSKWIRDYIFLPLGRQLFKTPLRRRPELIAAASYLVTFLAVGAWHGATPNFILWGAYHGVLLGAHHVYRKTLAARLAEQPFYFSAAAKIVLIEITCVAVAAGWILFLTPTPEAAVRLVQRMVGT